MMKSLEEMKKSIAKNEYIMAFDDESIYLMKGNGSYVEISPDRAKEWIEAGIKDLDCRNKEKMLKKIAQMEEENK